MTACLVGLQFLYYLVTGKKIEFHKRELKISFSSGSRA